MINKFISGLSAAERRVLIIASLFVLLALFDRLLVAPSVSRLKEIDNTIAQEETTVRQNMHFLAYRDRIVKEADSFKDFYTKSVKTEEEVIAEFLKKVELLATQSNIQMSKITPAGQDYQKDYLKYFVSLDCAGTLENLANFIYTINNSKELLKVEKMNFGATGKSGDNVQASLTISKMIIGADPTVEAKKLVRIKDEGAPVPQEVAPAPQQ